MLEIYVVLHLMSVMMLEMNAMIVVLDLTSEMMLEMHVVLAWTR